MKTIAFQTEFRPALPVVFGAKDDHEFRDTLEQMDWILTVTGIEDRMITRYVKSFAAVAAAILYHTETAALHSLLAFTDASDLPCLKSPH